MEKCPNCGGPVWDNRFNKKNPKGPDYKCKDKECAKLKGSAVWLKPKEDAPMTCPPSVQIKPGWTAPVKQESGETVKLLQSIDMSLRRLLSLAEIKNDPLEKEYRDIQGE